MVKTTLKQSYVLFVSINIGLKVHIWSLAKPIFQSTTCSKEKSHIKKKENACWWRYSCYKNCLDPLESGTKAYLQNNQNNKLPVKHHFAYHPDLFFQKQNELRITLNLSMILLLSALHLFQIIYCKFNGLWYTPIIVFNVHNNHFHLPFIDLSLLLLKGQCLGYLPYLFMFVL